MKKFENPEFAITRFNVVDVISTSDIVNGENQTPTAPPRG